jgi:uncharacterized protein HemX
MSKKKSSKKKKDPKAEAAAEDATFESVEDQPAQPVIAEEEIPAAEPLSAKPDEPAGPQSEAPRRTGGGFVAWLALVAAILALVAFAWDFIGDRRAAGDSLEDDAAIASVNSSVRALQDSIDALQQNVTALSDRAYQSDGAIDAITPRYKAFRLARKTPGCWPRPNTTCRSRMPSYSWPAIRNWQASHSDSRMSAYCSWQIPRSPMSAGRFPTNCAPWR